MYKIERIRGPKNLYNHRHAQLKNVVVKAFGILKSCFKIFRQTSPFSYKVWCRIVLPCCVIYNFIKRQQENDMYFNMPMEAFFQYDQHEDPMPLVGIDDSRRGDALRAMINSWL